MGENRKPDWDSALARARAHAPFLARALDRQPELAALLAAGEGEAALAWARSQGLHPDTEVALRRERLALAAALAVGDLAGAFPLARVVGELSGFADRALDRAIRTAIAERTGEERADGFIALALGKQGAGELNYSSDIDPILLYDRERLPRRASDDPGCFRATAMKATRCASISGCARRARSARSPCRWAQRWRIIRDRRWRGSAPPSPAPGRLRGMWRRARTSSPRSGPLCGAASSISARSRRSARSPSASVTAIPARPSPAPISM
jgi:hypothetical protein